ncbi:hypothetical protein GCM10017044_06520 [Kordiimonas sediminis]|uniref:PAS domain-containing protein n=1 Tax=Kordiimonas sediminis TaxID=1735581 RepID=A0A919ANX1_9PROT|nr:hypothetical protein [Kordiimonas sediminis]GHF15074.1 hypothetical protein GCM10017044_06520 [Kordiimonas sediminis]
MDETDITESDTLVEELTQTSGSEDDGAATGLERRLHIKAYDFWLGLKGDDPFPKFADLNADGLEPFKPNCLLLDVSTPGKFLVRYVGERVNELIDAPVERFSDLAMFPESGFARELVAQMNAEADDYQPAEFEFEENRVLSRGIFLPFTGVRDRVQFLLIVTNFKHIEEEAFSLEALVEAGIVELTGDEVLDAGLSPTDAVPDAESFSSDMDDNPEEDFDTASDAEGVADGEADVAFDPPSDQADDDSAPLPDGIAALLGRLETVDVQAGRSDAASRIALYELLAHAMELYQYAQDHAAEFKDLLKAKGLKMQARAPFTPILKIVFGLDYDKTRITEYASALSYAAYKGITSDDLAEFLNDFPGGIKGCVREERLRRRGIIGHPAHELQEEAMEALRASPALDLSSLKLDQEFSVVLVRKKDGGAEAVSQLDLGEASLDAAIRKIAKNLT